MEKINHNFKKKYGQNFLTDKNLLESIVSDAEISNQDTVVEIGAGAGALTEPLSEHAKNVISFEIDKELEQILNQRFIEKRNVKIVFEDFMNISEQDIYNLAGKNFKVVANLPYYITTPIISKLFELSFPPKTIVVMVQKEVGERIVAGKESSEYGYFSAYVASNAKAKIVRQVNRKMFTPMPNVDSCIVKLDVQKKTYEKDFFVFLKNIFKMKRKTIANNISSSYDISKNEIENKLNGSCYNGAMRADNLSPEELYEVYKIIFNKM